jgi:hypothetical protein
MAERALEFVYTPLFERTRKSLLTDSEMKIVEDELLADPDRGVLMRGTGGVRKLRATQENAVRAGVPGWCTCTLPSGRRCIF